MFYENLIACLFGLLLHGAMKWATARQEAAQIGAPLPGIVAYLKSVPAQTAVSIFATCSVFWVAHTMAWLNPGMGFACGYMGNSIADNLATKFKDQSSL